MLPSQDRRPVPVRTILAAIGMVLATVVGLYLLTEVGRILAWILIAAFFAVVLSPAVSFCERRLHLRRGLAATVVFLTGFLLLAAMLYTFIRPIVDQTQKFVDDFPEYVEDAEAGRGTIGRLVQRYDIDEWVRDNQDRLEDFRNELGSQAPGVLRSVANGLAALLTIVVLTILMLMQGPNLQQAALNFLDVPWAPHRKERVRRVAGDCARAVTGYMFGNFLISVVAGAATYVFLWIAGIPFREVLALWVAFADLIPLVGATLGAIPAVGVAFLHSTWAGIATLIFFIAYQQFENHVLQVTIMSRTVDLNPLAVLVSVLIGVELFGVLGALLAIPVAGVVQVIARDVYDEHRGHLKPEPTVGADEIPLSSLPEDEAV